MRMFGNAIWHFPFLGFLDALVVFLIGLLLTATVVAAPVGLGLIQLSKLLLAPFGHEMIVASKIADETGVVENKYWKSFSTVVMILWFPVGLLLSLFSIIRVGLLFLSIIGIPAGMAVAKSIATFFNPVNKTCVSSAVADELCRRDARRELARVSRSA